MVVHPFNGSRFNLPEETSLTKTIRRQPQMDGLYWSHRSSYLTTLMTRHTMRTAVSAHTMMTAFFSVGRCVMRDEIRDPTVASVTFCARSSSPTTAGGVGEFMRVETDERVCGSAVTRQRNAIAKVNTRLHVPMMLRYENITQNVVSLAFSRNTVVETQNRLSYYKASANDNVKAMRKYPSPTVSGLLLQNRCQAAL